MKHYNYYIGVDISKKTLDICVCAKGNKQHILRISNDSKGLASLKKSLKKWSITPKESMICLENTGFYSHLLAQWSVENKYDTWMANSLDIKKSLGLTRGQNDEIDAYRIALYAYRFEDKKQLWKPSSQAICHLQHLSTTRSRFVRMLSQATVPLQELEPFIPKHMQKFMKKATNPVIKGLKKSLELVEKQIQRHIEQHTELAKMHENIMSIKGVGNQLATGIIIASHAGQKLRDAKAMACYAGVAPFEHKSGTSVRGRTKVSPLANKSLKTLLHMGALSAIRNNQEIKAYYERKVAEGKPKMLVINAVRNKLITRIFACIRDGRKYQKNYIRKVA